MRKLLLLMLVSAFFTSQSVNLQAAEDSRPYLGIIFQTTNNGVSVVRVMENSPAERAGLQPHDIIVEVDHRDITVDTLAQVIWAYRPQEIVHIILQRGQQRIETEVTLQQRPADDEIFLKATQPPSTAIPELGIQLEDTVDGLVITGLYNDHPAIERLALGNQVVKICDYKVATTADSLALSDQIASHKSLPVEIERQGQRLVIELPVEHGLGHNEPANLSTFSFMVGMWRYDESGKGWRVTGLGAYPGGLRQNDMILRFNGLSRSPANLATFLSNLPPDQPVTLTVMRDTREEQIEILSSTLTNGGTFYMRDDGLLLFPFSSLRAV